MIKDNAGENKDDLVHKKLEDEEAKEQQEDDDEEAKKQQEDDDEELTDVNGPPKVLEKTDPTL